MNTVVSGFSSGFSRIFFRKFNKKSQNVTVRESLYTKKRLGTVWTQLRLPSCRVTLIPNSIIEPKIRIAG